MPGLTLAVLAIFCVAKAFSVGVNCADDAYFASIAKNVAYGLGYGTTVSGGGFVPFDPAIGTGPVVLLPTALAIAVVGNQHWLPGLTAVLLWSGLLVLVFLALRRAGGDVPKGALRDGAIIFVLGIPLLFPWHFEHWSNLLGEAPAAIFLLLAFALASATRLTERTVWLGSLACSLALLCKLLSAPGYFVFAGVVCIRLLLIERRPTREILRLLLGSVVVFAAPLLAFELFKVASVGGLRAYLDLAAQKFSFIKRQGVATQVANDLWSQLIERDATSLHRFGVSALQVLITTLVALWLVLRSRRDSLIWFAISLAATVLALSGYFLFLSNGWPRYFLIALILWLALLTSVVASLSSPMRIIAGCAGLGLLFSANYGKLPYLMNGFENGPFRASEELKSAIEITQMVNAALEEDPSAVFVTQIWPTTADIEYYAARPNVFRRYSRVGEETNFAVIYNKRFFNSQDAAFQEFLIRCQAPSYETGSHVVIRSKDSPSP